MKRVTYALFTSICGVLLHGAIHSAEVSAPVSPSQAVAQSSKEEAVTPVAPQPEGGPAEQPSGEIQERAVPTKPPLPLEPLEGVVPSAGSPLPGEFAMRLGGGYTVPFLTAVGGGGRATEAIHYDLTDASKIGAWEKFKLYVEPGLPRVYAIRTASGNYVTAVDGGGRSTEPVLRTDSIQFQAGEKFNVFQNPGGWNYIRVSNGNFLGFLPGTPILRTDLTRPSHGIRLMKCGDPGLDSWYMIAWARTGDDYKFREGWPFLQAYGGGGLLNGAVGPATTGPGIHFRLIRQADGSYGIQTENGQNFVTAVDGGGRITPPILQTNRTQVQANEKFRLWILPDCAYAFQTAKGFWLGMTKGPRPDDPVFLDTRTSGKSIRDYNTFRLFPTGFDPLPGS